MSVLGALAAAMGRGRRVPRVGFVRLTTKQGPRGYYKGKGVAATGTHTSKGALLGLRECCVCRCAAG
jgi:large subunit ribosomal protein L41